MNAAECKEEQKNEVEAIKSIFDREYRSVSKKPLKYELDVSPLAADDANNHVTATIEVSYPPMYPTVSPTLVVKGKKGLVPKQITELQELVEKEAATNCGQVVVFLIAESVKEWLSERNEPQRTMHEEMLHRTTRTDEQKALINVGELGSDESKGQARKSEPARRSLVAPGTIVTPESFANWQKLFKAEQDALKAERQAKDSVVADPSKPKKLTGRQLFEADQSLGVAITEAEEKDGPEVFWFNEAAYADDADLPDEVESEEENNAPEAPETEQKSDKEEYDYLKQYMDDDVEFDDADFGDETDLATSSPSAAKPPPSDKGRDSTGSTKNKSKTKKK